MVVEQHVRSYRKAQRPNRSVAWLLLILGVTACGGYCAPNRHIGDPVNESALIGEWRLTEESLRNLTDDGFRRECAHRYTITFKADHTCEFASVVDFLQNRYITAPCTWRLEHDVYFGGDSEANRLDLELHQARGTFALGFARENGALILWDFYGDPDLWLFLEYTKAEARK